MNEDIFILDANAVLRFLLQDVDEQFHQVYASIRDHLCLVTLEVLAEVAYVLEGVYQVPREEIADQFRKLVNDVTIPNADVLFRAMEVYVNPPKLDFVDCLMYGYQIAKGIYVLTFDKRLNSVLKRATG